jgi:hypothetical protein
VFLGLWWGVPTYNKWRADRLVDNLCAKDGGVKVFERAILQKRYFNKFVQPQIPDKKYATAADKFYSTWATKDIYGNSNSSHYSSLVIFRSEHDYFRKSDGKLLGEIIIYVRRGGDPIGPWHASHYMCPDREALINNIFIKSTEEDSK